jgi:hypothetical protein
MWISLAELFCLMILLATSYLRRISGAVRATKFYNVASERGGKTKKELSYAKVG